MHPLLVKLAEYYGGKRIPCALVEDIPALALCMAKDNAHHYVMISIDEVELACAIVFPGIVPEDKRWQIMEYIARASLMDPKNGQLQFDTIDGRIHYWTRFNNVGLLCPPKQMDKLIETCASIADYHVPALAGMLHGNMSPRAAAEHARKWGKNILKQANTRRTRGR